MTAGDPGAPGPGLPVQYVVGARLADGAAVILNDPELARLVEAWPALPAAVRAAIAGLVRARRPAAAVPPLAAIAAADASRAIDAADVDAPVRRAHASEIIRTVELELDAVQSEPAADVPRRQQQERQRGVHR